MNLLSIQQVAAKLGLVEEHLEPLGRVTGKIHLSVLQDTRYAKRGKLILVTGTTPTTAGEGRSEAAGIVRGLSEMDGGLIDSCLIAPIWAWANNVLGCALPI